jgi:hypothetical protein
MMLTVQELGEILQDSDIYRCTSETCSDNGGVCVLIVPCMFAPPEDGKDGCSYPDHFIIEDTDECDCKWVKIA